MEASDRLTPIRPLIIKRENFIDVASATQFLIRLSLEMPKVNGMLENCKCVPKLEIPFLAAELNIGT